MRHRGLLVALTAAATAFGGSALVGVPLPTGPAAADVRAASFSGLHALPAPPRDPGVAPPLERPFVVADGVVRRTLAFGSAGLAQTVDVYGPPGAPAPRPTVLLVHGGSWQIGDSTEWADEAVQLVRERGWTAVALNYRLAPDHRWPAPYEDAAAALRLLHARAGELGVDPARVGALGDSAGGHLAALLGEPADDRPVLRSVVTWSGLNDLAGLTQQPSAGGCAGTSSCELEGLARKVVDGLMGCAPEQCPAAYRAASPAALVTPGHAATLALGSEDEQVDPRQAWVMDAALSRNRVPSRVEVLDGDLHARGYQGQAWVRSLAFLAATLTPETSPAYPRAAPAATLDAPADAEPGEPVVLSGSVSPRQHGSSVALQTRRPDGTWRTARQVRLQRGPGGTSWSTTWTPVDAGTVTWRATWRGSGGEAVSPARTVVVR